MCMDASKYAMYSVGHDITMLGMGYILDMPIDQMCKQQVSLTKKNP